MIRFGIRAARPLYTRQRLGAERGRALRMNRAGLWKPIETRKALLIGVANQRFTTLARSFNQVAQRAFADQTRLVVGDLARGIDDDQCR